MKLKFFPLLLTAWVAWVVLAASGCATSKQTEDLLSAAGFKMVPATTPEQKHHLQTLPANTVTALQKEGRMYFVYPDVAKQMLYVGQEPQYQEFQRLRVRRQMAEAQVQAAQMNTEAAWAGWGVWGPIGLAEPAPVYHRW